MKSGGPGRDPGPADPTDIGQPKDTNELLSAALTYVEWGWAVFPTHSFPDGSCTCSKSLTCESPAKHPRTPNGLHDATIDPEVVKGWWANWPDANVAIATGAVSKLIAIDVDMHGEIDGEETYRELIEDLGQHLETVEVQTGGGGRAVMFHHPGVKVGNSASKLGPGVDVRGDGGYIIAPPSMHASGRRYEWELSSDPADVEMAELPEAWVRAITEPAQPSSTHGDDPDRWGGPLNKARILNGLPEGERDQMIFLEARSLRGRGFDRSEAEVIIRTIAARCKPPFSETEALKKVARVWDDHAPNDHGFGEVNQKLDRTWNVVDGVFPHIKTDIGFAHKQGVLPHIATIADLDPIGFEGLMSKVENVHGDEAVTELRAAVAGVGGNANGNPKGSRFNIVFGDAIESLPPPEWQVEDILVKGSLAFLYGKPGIGKSIAALDLAGSVSAGIDWHGHPVIQGRALYVVAEGLGDFGLRVRAFRIARNLDCLPDMGYVLEPVNLFKNDGIDADVLAQELAEWNPSLIVFDTLARSVVGGDENSAKDMGIVIAAADRLRHRLRPTVLIVAHTGKDGKLLRGSSALDGAADTTIKAERKDGLVTLTCDKQKMAARFSPMSFRLEQVGESVVLVPSVVGTKLAANQELGVKLVPPEGITFTAWQIAFVEAGGAKDTFPKVLKSLGDKGLIEKEGEGRGAIYLLTKEGTRHV